MEDKEQVIKDLKKERDNLINKIDRLKSFIDQEEPSITDSEGDLLKWQYDAMISYRDALVVRIFDLQGDITWKH